MRHIRLGASLNQEQQLIVLVKEEKGDTVYTEFLINVIHYGNRENKAQSNHINIYIEIT